MAIHYKLRQGVTLQEQSCDQLLVDCDGRVVRCQHADEAFKRMLSRLASSGGLANDLFTAAAQGGGAPVQLTLFLQLMQLEQRGWLTLMLMGPKGAALVLEPMGRQLQRRTPLKEPFKIRFSRFICIRPEHGELQLEVPFAAGRVQLVEARLSSLLPVLAVPCSTEQLREQLPDDLRDQWQDLLTLLRTAGLVGVCDAEGGVDVDQEAERHRWSYEDLALHHRSRLGWHRHVVGASFRGAGVCISPPLLLAAEHLPAVVLPRPVKAGLDPSFFDVVEQRQSIRSYADTPLNLDQLSRLLWYTARIRRRFGSNVESEQDYEACSRPVAGGGGLHEIDLYLTVRRCSGLEAGLYRYDPQAHQLLRLSELSEVCKQLLLEAGQGAALTQEPDILITLAARYGRVTWKYEGMPYALILKHVGVIYQHLYLVATALGLAPCGLGAGNSETFAQATGLDRFAHIPVGEFILGRPADIKQESC
ncbi:MULTISPECIES: SagB/ThcOx family dehydrogenase [Prochlorococcus]|uniref:SagB/ThcOx family dehydrogenase n=1 Tax=Prochlorococcus TaxID=1218 RepID=UPI0007B3E855|nr:SagB family peptide dehydrogenase [Prochlorococcus marinus]KZR79321.1 Nitroreductase family protein [Prochlorococcus marinus str. MIT 1327]